MCNELGSRGSLSTVAFTVPSQGMHLAYEVSHRLKFLPSTPLRTSFELNDATQNNPIASSKTLELFFLRAMAAWLSVGALQSDFTG